jgi:hypothetical protein
VTFGAKKMVSLAGVVALAATIAHASSVLAAAPDLVELPRLANGAVDFTGAQWSAITPAVGEVMATDRFERNGVTYRVDVRNPWTSGFSWGANPLVANAITNERDGDSHTYSYNAGNATTSSFLLATAGELWGLSCHHARAYYTGTIGGSPVAARQCGYSPLTGVDLTFSDVVRLAADGRIVHDVTVTNVGTAALGQFGFGVMLDTMLDQDDEVPLIKSAANAIYMQNGGFRLYLTMTQGDLMLAGSWAYAPDDFGGWSDVADSRAGGTIVDGVDSAVVYQTLGNGLAVGASARLQYEERVFSASEIQPAMARVTLVDDDRAGAEVAPVDPGAAVLTGEPLTEVGFTWADAEALVPTGYAVASIDNVALYDDDNSTVQEIMVYLVHDADYPGEEPSDSPSAPASQSPGPSDSPSAPTSQPPGSSDSPSTPASPPPVPGVPADPPQSPAPSGPPAPPGSPAPVATPPAAKAPQIVRFGTRFKTVVIPAGTTTKVKVATYPAPGTRAGTTRVTWKTGSASVASPVKGKKTGTMSWRTGSTATVALKAFAAGRTQLTLTSPGASPVTIRIKVVSQATAQTKRLREVDLDGPGTLAIGRSTVLKPELTPAGAIRSGASWRSTDPEVATVNAVGRVTAKSTGRTVIVLKVEGKTAKKTITVR